MILFLLIVAGLWGAGAMTRTPVPMRLGAIFITYIGVLLLVILLPHRNPFGHNLSEWLLFGAGMAVVLAYQFGLKKLRLLSQKKAPLDERKAIPDALSEVELNRYLRHIVLHEIGGMGQKNLKQSKVLVIGAGGLGAPVLQYLTASGVGTIGVIDDDVVDASNLQRQVIHIDDRIDMPKVFSAEKAMRAQNPYVTVKPYQRRFDADCVDLVAEYDLVIDGSDNFDTRYLVNAACHAAKIPLLSAAITQWEGQISTYNTDEKAPCYQCVFPERPAEGLAPSCAQAGVVAPLPGVLGTMLALEAIKEITGAGQGLTGRLMIYDALYGETRMINVKKRPDCPICGPQNTQ